MKSQLYTLIIFILLFSGLGNYSQGQGTGIKTNLKCLKNIIPGSIKQEYQNFKSNNHRNKKIIPESQHKQYDSKEILAKGKFPRVIYQGEHQTCSVWAFIYYYLTHQFVIKNDSLDPHKVAFSPTPIYTQLLYKNNESRCNCDSTSCRFDLCEVYKMVLKNPLYSYFSYNKLENCDLPKQEEIFEKKDVGIQVIPKELLGKLGEPQSLIEKEKAKLVATIKELIQLKRPVLFTFYASSSFKILQEKIWVPKDDEWPDKFHKNKHAMIIVGYDDDLEFKHDRGRVQEIASDGWYSFSGLFNPALKDNVKGAFKVLNSYGTNWGDPLEKGFAWIPYKFFYDWTDAVYQIPDLEFIKIPKEEIDKPEVEEVDISELEEIVEPEEDPVEIEKDPVVQIQSENVPPQKDTLKLEPQHKTIPLTRPTLYLISAAGIDSTKLGLTRKKDVEKVQFELGQVSLALNYEFKHEYLVGTSFNEDSLNNAISTFRTKPEDIFVFYFRGEGTFAQTEPCNWKTMVLNNKKEYVRISPLLDQIDTLQKANFKLVITDFTEDYLGAFNFIFRSDKIKNRFNPNIEFSRNDTHRYRELFLQSKNLFWIASHCSGKENHASKRYGSYFTQSFIQALSKASDVEQLQLMINNNNNLIAAVDRRSNEQFSPLLRPSDGGISKIEIDNPPDRNFKADSIIIDNYKRLLKRVMEQSRNIDFQSYHQSHFRDSNSWIPLLNYWEESFSEEITIEILGENDMPNEVSIKDYLDQLKINTDIENIEIIEITLNVDQTINTIIVRETRRN